MKTARRLYRREGEESRRAALIAATQSLVAEGGPEAATVRAIAARAGVTVGLIRHYFQSKEELIRASYRDFMDWMTQRGAEAVALAAPTAEGRLAAFVAATLRPPVMEAGSLVHWAGYMHKLRNEPEMLAVHESGYLFFRDTLEGLIAALPRASTAEQRRREAIACNAVLDGLWIEGSLLPGSFAGNELLSIGLDSVGAILGIDLLAKAKDLPEFGKTT